MNRLLFLALAVAVPLCALLLAAPPERVTSGLIVRPFGWPSLLVIHVLGAVPFSWLLAQLVVRLRPQVQSLPGILGGLVAACLTYRGIESVADSLDDAQAGFAVRAFVRSLLCVVLAFPWCLAANASRVCSVPDRLQLIAAVVLAIGLPMIQADRIADEAWREAVVELEAGRVVRAEPLLSVAADVSPNRVPSGLVKKTTVAELRARTTKDIAKLTGWIQRPPATPRIEFADVLVKLDRLAAAEAYLRPMATTSPDARFLLAQCLFLQGRWAESEAEFRLFPDRPAAYDFRAEIAMKQHRPAEREAVLRDAQEKLPAHAGYWHLQLGKHFLKSGRPMKALEEFAEAERIDPKLQDELEPLRQHIREHTPGCLVR